MLAAGVGIFGVGIFYLSLLAPGSREGVWLPAAGLHPLPAPGWERYDERWDPRTKTGPVDIYIPVHRPAARAG